MARVLIGTSGWTYSSWKGRFYPEDWPSRRYLEYYAREFETTEINYSFYHLPQIATYRKWVTQVPDRFTFALKASRFITHVKRLLDVEDAWRTFVGNARFLGDHLGPILLQFPPSFRCDLPRLSAFLQFVSDAGSFTGRTRLACEFRHPSWFKEDLYRLLSQHGAAFCIADGARYPRYDVVTTDWVYLRFHGRSRMFASNYTEEELAVEAGTIARFWQDGLDVCVYFNNDAEGYAVNNARTLRGLVAERGVR